MYQEGESIPLEVRKPCASNIDRGIGLNLMLKVGMIREGILPAGMNADEYRLMAEAARRTYPSVPDDVVSRAKSLMVPDRTFLRARLVSSSLRMVGVRSLAMDKFQLVFEAESVQARLLYMLEGKHWEVVGKVNGSDWKVSRPGGRVRNLGDGRFEFTAPALSDTGLVLRNGNTSIDVPSAEEAGFAGCF